MRYVAVFCALLLVALFWGCRENGQHESWNALACFPNTDKLEKNIPKESKDVLIYTEILRSLSAQKIRDIEELSQEYVDNEDIIFVYIFRENPDGHFFREGLRNCYFVHDPEDKIAKCFNAPLCCNSFFVFNKNKGLALKGILDSRIKRDISAYLWEMLRDASTQFFDASFRLKKIRECGLLAALLGRQDQSSCKAPISCVALINDICAGCISGSILNMMNTYHVSQANNVEFTVYVSGEYEDVDIHNMAKSLSIQIPISRAPLDVMEPWNYLKARLPDHFNNIFLLFDSQGHMTVCLDEEKPDEFIAMFKTLI